MKIYLCLLFVAFVATSFKVVSCEIKFGVGENPPYAYKTKQGLWKGSDIDKIKKMVTSVNCNLTYVEGSFSERLLMLNKGLIDVMPNISKLEERNSYVFYIGPLRAEKLSLVTTSEISERISSLEDISNLNYFFGKPAKAYLGKKFHQLYSTDSNFSKKFIDIYSTEDIYNLLDRGRIVGFFEESNSLGYHLESSNFYLNLKRHPVELDTGDIYFGVSKKSMKTDFLMKLKQSFTH